jgi:hypothetical protein
VIHMLASAAAVGDTGPIEQSSLARTVYFRSYIARDSLRAANLVLNVDAWPRRESDIIVIDLL